MTDEAAELWKELARLRGLIIGALGALCPVPNYVSAKERELVRKLQKLGEAA